ncbi:MAG: ARMT1-like domain-containing protein [Gammaproteobacteria bacterium]|nr:ARMT1-like domain-containing protein [Gammaproteobacteria bacterium]
MSSNRHHPVQAKPVCDQCFMRQAGDAASRCSLPADQKEALLKRIESELVQFPIGSTPPVRASHVHALIRQFSGNPDPYLQAKHESTEHALSLYPKLKQMLSETDDPLDMAVRLAIAGNIIDLGVASEYDLEASIERVLRITPAINHMKQLKQAIEEASSILYLADNAGETVMDRLLIETIKKPVTYVVKGGPAVNDATLEDAIAAGIDQVAEIIDNGAATLGTLLNQCSEQFIERYNTAELIIAKGMANYEGLTGNDAPIFFLFQVKCGVIGEHIGVPEKSIIILNETAK